MEPQLSVSWNKQAMHMGSTKALHSNYFSLQNLLMAQ